MTTAMCESCETRQVRNEIIDALWAGLIWFLIILAAHVPGWFMPYFPEIPGPWHGETTMEVRG